MESIYVLAIVNHKSSIVLGFPPQMRIVPAFINPPDIVCAVLGFVHKVPACFEECIGSLHLGSGFANSTVTA